MVNKVECDCGMSVALHRLSDHKQGARHRRGALIRRMLDKSEATLSDIARDLNLSRERIRQIAQVMGLETGRQRQHRRHKERAEMAVKALFDDLPVASMEGYTVVPILNAGNALTKHVRVRQVLINGRRCAIRTASSPPSIARGLGENWVRINRPNGRAETAEFVLFRLPDHLPAAKGWLVVPMADMPAYPANVNLTPEAKGSVMGSYQSRLRGYLNAWELLRPKALNVVDEHGGNGLRSMSTSSD